MSWKYNNKNNISIYKKIESVEFNVEKENNNNGKKFIPSCVKKFKIHE